MLFFVSWRGVLLFGLIFYKDSARLPFLQKFTDITESSPEFIKDCTEQLDYQKKSKGNGRSKGQNAIKHDMLLWHFCDAKRKEQKLSNFMGESQYWIVTVDFQLVGFDKYKQTQRSPVSEFCLLPSTLVSMLQLWTPRTPEFEEAIISSIRPLLSHGLDSDAERVTLEILTTISRFEDIGDVTEEVMINTLMDEGIRSRIASADANIGKDSAQIIKDSLAKQLEEKSRREKILAEEVEKKERELAYAQQKLEEKDTEKTKLSSEKDVLSERISQIEGEKEERDKQIQTLVESELQKQERIANLEEKVREREAQDQFNKFVRNRLFIPAVIVIPIALVSGYLVDSVNPYRIDVLIVSVIVFGILIYFILRSAESRGRELEHVAHTKVIDRIGKFKFWTAFILGVVFSVVGNLISELIQLK